MKTELLDAYLCGDLRGESAAFIEAALKSDAALREAYFQQVRMDAALRVLLADEELAEVTPTRFAAGIMARLSSEGTIPAAEADDRRLARSVLMEIMDERGARPRPSSAWEWAKASLVAAAAVAITILALDSVRIEPGGNPAAAANFPVAQVTAASAGAVWKTTPVGVEGVATENSRDWLRPCRFDLKSGVAEIAFASGARVFLESPAVLNIERPSRAFLESGRLTAEVPKPATGFVINTPRINLVDLGTRFGLSVEGNGDTEVHVMQGVVEVSRLTGNVSPLILEEGRAVRADGRTRSDLQPIDYAGDRFTLQALPAAEAPSAPGFVHYGFDETGGPEIEDDGRGLENQPFDASLFPDDLMPARPKRSVGRSGGGLVFAAGERFDSAALGGAGWSEQGLSVAFWLRLPPRLDDVAVGPAMRLVPAETEDAALWEMAPNHDPALGNAGALTIRSGGAQVSGSTDLEDGRWHHVGFRYVGGERRDVPSQVHLYVDGKLEAVSGYRSGPPQSGLPHQLWIGGEAADVMAGFEGAVDEIYVFPEAVAPWVFQQLADGEPHW